MCFMTNTYYEFQLILKVWHYYITAHSSHACLQTFGSSLGRKNSLELQQRYSRVVQCLLEYDNFLCIGFIPCTPTPDLLYWGNRSKLLLSCEKEAWCTLLIKYYINTHILSSTISFWSEITKSTNDFFFFSSICCSLYLTTCKQIHNSKGQLQWQKTNMS